MTAAVHPYTSAIARLESEASARTQTPLPPPRREAVIMRPEEFVPEMIPPTKTVLVPPPVGYSRFLEMREDAPYFNASVYCNRINLRFSLWLRHPATTALINSFANYYREASHEISPPLIMQVKSGPRVVHGYYIHTMLHDALASWCDFELSPPESRPRLPPISRNAI